MIVIILVCVDFFKRRILNKDKEKYRKVKVKIYDFYYVSIECN